MDYNRRSKAYMINGTHLVDGNLWTALTGREIEYILYGLPNLVIVNSFGSQVVFTTTKNVACGNIKLGVIEFNSRYLLDVQVLITCIS